MYPIDHISPSMLKLWLSCGAKFVFKYLELVPSLFPVPILIGLAAHKAAQKNHEQKITTMIDMPEDEITDIAADSFSSNIKETGVFLTKDEKFMKNTILGDGKDRTVKAARIYSAKVAHTIRPKTAETYLKSDLGFGLPLVAKPDVIDLDDLIIDLKVGRKQNQDWADTDLQPTFLTALWKDKANLDSFPKFKYHTIVNNKSPYWEDFNTIRDEKDIKVLSNLIRTFLKSLKAGVFKPATPGIFPCTPKYCNFWYICPYVKS